MKAVIFAGGKLSDYKAAQEYLKGADIIICADSGFHHAMGMGVVPDLLLGDMDSISGEDLKKAKSLGVEMQGFPREKDYTDTMLALEAARERGATSALLLAGIGDRPDHSLANAFLMLQAKKMGIELTLAGENWEMFLIYDQAEISGQRGELLSLIPLSAEAVGIETQGLYYPLRGESISLGVPRGISNVFTGEKAVVKLKGGILLAVKIVETPYQAL